MCLHVFPLSTAYLRGHVQVHVPTTSLFRPASTAGLGAASGASGSAAAGRAPVSAGAGAISTGAVAAAGAALRARAVAAHRRGCPLRRHRAGGGDRIAVLQELGEGGADARLEARQ